MIPSWVRWVEVAQVLEGSQAGELQDWLADHGIAARIRSHRVERPGTGTSVGYQVLPDRAPAIGRYSIEVRRDNLDRAHAALEASGWTVQGYEGRWWISQSLTLVGMALTVTIVIGLVILIRVLGEN